MAEQTMLHRQDDLRDNLQLAVHKHVERVRHHPLGRVLHRHDPVVRPVLADLGEDIGNGLLRRNSAGWSRTAGWPPDA